MIKRDFELEFPQIKYCVNRKIKSDVLIFIGRMMKFN